MNNPFRLEAPPIVDDTELKELAAFVEELAHLAGKAALPLFRSSPETEEKVGKGYYDPVTEADKSAEKAIRARIKEAYPGHGIFGEEFGHDPGDTGLTWVIDPIDGTRAFISGKPTWGTLIGLHNGEKSILGTMFQPYTDELFIGAPGINLAQFKHRGETSEIRTSDCRELDRAILTSTHPQMFRPGKEQHFFDELVEQVRFNGFGCDCYGFALVALGTMDLAVERGLAPYDIQALIPIIEAAGGIVTDWWGKACDTGGTAIAAATPELHAEALKILSQVKPDD